LWKAGLDKGVSFNLPDGNFASIYETMPTIFNVRLDSGFILSAMIVLNQYIYMWVTIQEKFVNTGCGITK